MDRVLRSQKDPLTPASQAGYGESIVRIYEKIDCYKMTMHCICMFFFRVDIGICAPVCLSVQGMPAITENAMTWFTSYLVTMLIPWVSINDSHDVIKWKHFPHYWPFVWEIHRSPVNSLHKGQWRGSLMFSLIGAWLNGCINNGEAGDLRCHRAHLWVREWDIIPFIVLMA